MIEADHLSRRPAGDFAMFDILLLGLGLGFFALTIGYGVLCDRL